MTIRVYKPQEIKNLIPDEGGIRLWAVWEDTDGNHHEECYEYRKGTETCRAYNRGIVYETEAHPLLTDEYEEDPERVLPGTLRFIRPDDLLKLYRFVDTQGNIYAINWPAHDTYASSRHIYTTLNGFKLHMVDNGLAHILAPRTFDPDEQIEPDEFNTGKEQEA